MTPKPEFHLRRVDADGSSGPVEVFPVYALPADTQLSRRGLIGTGVTVASVLSLVGGCKRKQPEPAPGGASGGPRAEESAQHLPGRTATEVYAHLPGPSALAVTPDGKTLISAGGGSIKLWSLPDGKLVRPCN